MLLLQSLLFTFLVIILFCSTFVQLSTSSTTTLPSSSSSLNKNSTNETLSAYQMPYTSCYFDETCERLWGLYSRCYDGTCICNFGYQYKYEVCTKVWCSSDSDCTPLFSNTQCSNGNCVCQTGLEIDSKSQSCQKVSPNPPYCYLSSDCRSKSSYGFDSFCNGSQCACKLGYSQTFGGSEGCSQFSCNFDYECSRKWPNTECSPMSNCRCRDYDYSLDENTQTCEIRVIYPSGEGDGGEGVTVFVSIIILIVIISVVSWISVCVKSSQQQQQQQTRARQVYRQATPANNNQSLSPDRRLPMPRLTVPQGPQMFPQMDTPPPAYTEAVQNSSVVQVFPGPNLPEPAGNASSPPSYGATGGYLTGGKI